MNYLITKTKINKIEILTSINNGGFSSSPIDSNNMSYDVGDNPDHVVQNREKFLEETGLFGYNLVVPKQRNTDIILKVNSITDDRECDSLYTYNQDFSLAILHNENSPIFYYIKEKEIIGAINMNKNSTLLGISKRTIKTLINIERVKPENIYIFFGPGGSITKETYNQDKYKKMENIGFKDFLTHDEEHSYLNLKQANISAFIKAGVPLENIQVENENSNDQQFHQELGKSFSIIRFKK